LKKEVRKLVEKSILKIVIIAEMDLGNYLIPLYYLEEENRKSSGNRYLENYNYIKHKFWSL